MADSRVFARFWTISEVGVWMTQNGLEKYCKTYQAQRHHKGKYVNPGISLQKPTRDLNEHPSINEHYAMADLQYSLNEFHDSGSILARDDKALVHTDVEVVQRPSKSWIRINYSDHDWQRTLSITTYQFVEVAELKLQDEIASHLGSLGICKTRVKGNGVSLVKVHYFEQSSAFRHMNELLYIMSLEKHVSHFTNSRQLLVTVDGGGDERPRNKITQFCAVLVRWLLDLDKYKCHSLAEGSSKYHSVERLHTAENRALSQYGVISSRLAHTREVNEQGVFDITKFEQNMKLAQAEAVKRIDGVTYSNDKIVSYSAPEVKDWVFKPEYEMAIKKLLQTDSSSHRIENNLLIRPEGLIWDQLCHKYSISHQKSTSAIHIFNAVVDPHASTCTHYSFATYRLDDSWRGLPVKRYELQPIVDIGRLPEHHYLPYKEAKHLAEMFDEGDLPDWLAIPDFFLPSQNIKRLMENYPDLLDKDIDSVSNLIGVPKQKILHYIGG